MLPKLIEDKIKNLAKREGYITFNIEIQNTLKKGSGYLGKYYQVKIKGKTNVIDKEINIFVKKMIAGETVATFCLIEVAYQNELFAYQELSKMFIELQEQYKVPVQKRFKMVKCFEESDEEVIILDDVTHRGFTVYDRIDEVNLKFLELSIQELAKFHALSFALEYLRPAYYEGKIKNKIIPCIWNKTEDPVFEHIMRVTVKNIQDEVIKKKTEEFIPEALKKYTRYFDNRFSEILCLCHGDYRPLNIIMKENNNEISEVIPIDYQLLHYGCPINDLIFGLFSGTTKQIRSQHLEHLKNLYYSTLTNFCEHFNVYIDNILPRRKFEEMFKERLDYGLIVATCYAPIDFASENDVLNLESEATEKWETKLDDKFQDRFKGVVENFIEWGYL